MDTWGVELVVRRGGALAAHCGNRMPCLQITIDTLTKALHIANVELRLSPAGPLPGSGTPGSQAPDVRRTLLFELAKYRDEAGRLSMDLAATTRACPAPPSPLPLSLDESIPRADHSSAHGTHHSPRVPLFLPF
jgi:hypothetical protein